MAFKKKINLKAKAEINSGFGTNSSDYGGRFLNKNGKANIEKQGVKFLEGISWYHSLLAMPRWKFFSVIFFFFIIVNIFFALIYFLIGIEHLAGVVPKSPLENFLESFFLVAKTLVLLLWKN